MNKFKLSLVVSSSAFLVGCNSLNWHAEGERARAYPGVAADFDGLANAHSTGMYAPFIYVYSAVDMPFSLVTDTLYLPSDMVDVHRRNKRDLEHSRTNQLNDANTDPLPATPGSASTKK